MNNIQNEYNENLFSFHNKLNKAIYGGGDYIIKMNFPSSLGLSETTLGDPCALATKFKAFKTSADDYLAAVVKNAFTEIWYTNALEIIKKPLDEFIGEHLGVDAGGDLKTTKNIDKEFSKKLEEKVKDIYGKIADFEQEYGQTDELSKGNSSKKKCAEFTALADTSKPTGVSTKVLRNLLGPAGKADSILKRITDLKAGTAFGTVATAGPDLIAAWGTMSKAPEDADVKLLLKPLTDFIYKDATANAFGSKAYWPAFEKLRDQHQIDVSKALDAFNLAKTELSNLKNSSDEFDASPNVLLIKAMMQNYINNYQINKDYIALKENALKTEELDHESKKAQLQLDHEKKLNDLEQEYQKKINEIQSQIQNKIDANNRISIQSKSLYNRGMDEIKKNADDHIRTVKTKLDAQTKILEAENKRYEKIQNPSSSAESQHEKNVDKIQKVIDELNNKIDEANVKKDNILVDGNSDLLTLLNSLDSINDDVDVSTSRTDTRKKTYKSKQEYYRNNKYFDFIFDGGKGYYSEKTILDAINNHGNDFKIFSDSEIKKLGYTISYNKDKVVTFHFLSGRKEVPKNQYPYPALTDDFSPARFDKGEYHPLTYKPHNFKFKNTDDIHKLYKKYFDLIDSGFRDGPLFDTRMKFELIDGKLMDSLGEVYGTSSDSSFFSF